MSGKRRPGPSVRTRVVELTGPTRIEREDRLATEEPLEIRLAAPGLPARALAVTMRTPGHDFELATGWMVHEQILGPDDITAVRYCTDAELAPEQEFNVVTVESDRAPRRLPESRLISSACGVCGSDVVQDVLQGRAEPPPVPAIAVADLRRFPTLLREAQHGFDRTGALHAAGLFEADGTSVVVREDIGRHNAVDKVVGSRVLAGTGVPPVLVLSGRIGFELVQKAVVSRVAVLVAVGAPSSLAVSLAESAGLALVGFTRPDRCVVYAGATALGV